MNTVAIVGSGPSAIYALQALLKASQALAITIFEVSDTAGVGTPYDPRTNSVEMLANIASIEIPPIGLSLLDYLKSCSDEDLAQIGIVSDVLHDRQFYPRIALGAYFRDRLAALARDAASQGHSVSILTHHDVVDVVPTQDGIDVRFVAGHARPLSRRFDRLVLATGHTVPAARSAELPKAYGRDAAGAEEIGVFGSSLSAIDLAVSVACGRGAFRAGRYELAADAAPFRITMMSRGGRLPEADFYCPLPPQPIEGFTEKDVAALVASTEPGQVLDRVFAQFAATLALADPDYAARIRLDRLTAASFADAYFAERDAREPFVWAQKNLEEARRNHDNRHVVPWRYTILRCHEAFAICVAALDERELKRFNAGLRRVFADNYSAVPLLSIERLIALDEAGVLRVCKLGDDYDVAIDEGTGRATVRSGGAILSFDRIFDARGQAAADEDAFPFPTLRMVLKANRDLAARHDAGAVKIDADYRLSNGRNPLRNVWCLSLPFLLERRPFIQGLRSAAEMGKRAADALISDVVASPEDPVTMEHLLHAIASTQPVMLVDGAVMLAPKT